MFVNVFCLYHKGSYQAGADCLIAVSSDFYYGIEQPTYFKDIQVSHWSLLRKSYEWNNKSFHIPSFSEWHLNYTHLFRLFDMDLGRNYKYKYNENNKKSFKCFKNIIFINVQTYWREASKDVNRMRNVHVSFWDS